MRSGLIVVVALAIFAAPLRADVVPARRATKAADGERVAERVTALGIADEDARAQVAALTETDMRFFALRAASVQVVGARQDMFSGESSNIWYETALGAVTLGGALGTIVYMFRNNE